MNPTLRILHLEDVKSDADLAARELRNSNVVFDHLVIDRESEYRRALDEFKPDIILCDHSLPSFNSMEALRIVKAKNLNIPFILITATMSEEVAAGIVKEGADDYILKDRLKRLPNAVMNAFGKYQYERERKQLIDEVQAKEILSKEALTRALNDIKKIMDASLDVICSIGEDGRFVSVSSAAKYIWGYEPEEMVGRSSSDFVAPQDLQMTADVAAKVRSGINFTMFENSYIHRDGHLVPLLWSARWDENDRLVYCVAKNASEKKRLEQLVENKRKRYSDLFMQAPSAIAVFNGPDHRYEMANPLYLALVGQKDVVGMSVHEVFTEVADQPLVSLIGQVYETGEPFAGYEMAVMLRDTETGGLKKSYLNFIYQPFKSTEGLVEGVFFFANDVSEQVLARKKIEESDKRFKQIVETAQEGIWMLDKCNRTNFVNGNLCRILEYPETDIVGKPMHHFMKGDKKNLVRGNYNKGLPVTTDSYDAKFSTSTGRLVWMNLSCNPLLNNEGEYEGALVMVTDITMRKKLQERIIRQKVQQQKEITKTALLAQERERNYLGGELHDNINQILAAVKLQMKIFLEKTGAEASVLRESYENVEFAMEEIRMLSQRLVTHRFDTDSLADELDQMIQSLQRTGAIILDVTHLKEKLIHENIKLTLFRIAQEQLSNTIKHARASSTEVLLFNNRRTVTLIVKDNGVGYDTKKKYRGVGLTNIFNRVQSYNGSVKIQSAPGEGCCLTVEIPLKRQIS